MAQDRLRPSLLEKLQEGDRQNIALLLDMLYGDFMAKLSLVETQLKGRLSEQESRLVKGEQRFQRLENCPCAVHRDPAHDCLIMEINETLGGLKLELTQEVGRIKVRLAWWGGALSVLILIFQAVAYLWPWLRR